MRRGKRVKVVELPKADPVEIHYVVQPGIPVEIPVMEPVKVETIKSPERKFVRR
jgi:hypothetical protein